MKGGGVLPIRYFPASCRKGEHMITAQKYTETYNLWTEQLQENAERIIRSSEARKYLIKNSAEAPLEDLLLEAVKCISDLTGDTILTKTVIRNLERRRHDDKRI